MTTNEAAEALGISRSRVIALIIAKRLKAIKRGRDYHIENKDLKAVANRKHGKPKKVR